MLAERLKECRKMKNVTQREVAEYLGMAVKAYQRYELGTREPNIDALNKLADYFEVSVDYLLGRKNYWQDSDENIKVKVPPDIFNLDTDALKKKLGQD